MKMKPEHFEHMRKFIAIFDCMERRVAFRRQSNSLRGYQWYLVRHAGLLPFVCDTLYQYLNDDHIQTALNRIIPSFESEVRA